MINNLLSTGLPECKTAFFCRTREMIGKRRLEDLAQDFRILWKTLANSTTRYLLTSMSRHNHGMKEARTGDGIENSNRCGENPAAKLYGRNPARPLIEINGGVWLLKPVGETEYIEGLAVQAEEMFRTTAESCYRI